jgi:hypothetical protein
MASGIPKVDQGTTPATSPSPRATSPLTIDTSKLGLLNPTIIMMDGINCGPGLDANEVEKYFPTLVSEGGSVRYDLLCPLLLLELKNTNRKLANLVKDYHTTKENVSAEIALIRKTQDTYEKAIDKYLHV